jgi:hypothetical protein
MIIFLVSMLHTKLPLLQMYLSGNYHQSFFYNKVFAIDSYLLSMFT